MKRIFILLFLIGLLTWITCNYYSVIFPNSLTPKNIHQFKKDIPKNWEGKEFYQYEITQKGARQAQMTVIENGFDSICFRLWYFYGSEIKVVDIKNALKKWTVHVYAMRDDSEGRNFKITKLNSTEYFPKSGWKYFITRMLSFKIMELPDDSKLPQYEQSSDASFVVVEIATQENYRIYSYSDPALFLNIKEANKMVQILKLIEDEIGVKRLDDFQIDPNSPN